MREVESGATNEVSEEIRRLLLSAPHNNNKVIKIKIEE
tara:strand:- start:694 stop:807 length:114 start_codon:yes stop_codon:yes gene_type:complete